MLPQALKIMKSENYKITKGYESTFKDNNGGYGLAGAFYYMKCLASGQGMYEEDSPIVYPKVYSLTEGSISDYADQLPDQYTVRTLHNLSAQKLIEPVVSHIGRVKHGYNALEDEEVVYALRSDGKFEISDRHRMKLPDHQDFDDIYKNIAQDIYYETGHYPEITSTFRDRKTQKEVNSVTDYSYHLDGQAIDLRRVSFSPADQKKVESVLGKYALQGEIIFRIEKKPPHWHIVMVSKGDRVNVAKYFKTNTKKTTKVENKPVGKFGEMNIVNAYDKFKLGTSITGYKKGLAFRDQDTGSLLKYIPEGDAFDVMAVVENKYMKRYKIRYKGRIGTVTLNPKDVRVRR